MRDRVYLLFKTYVSVFINRNVNYMQHAAKDLHAGFSRVFFLLFALLNLVKFKCHSKSCIDCMLYWLFCCTAIVVHFAGYGRVSWDERRAYTKGSAPVVSLKNTEQFLNQTIVLLKKGENYLFSLSLEICLLPDSGTQLLR